MHERNWWLGVVGWGGRGWVDSGLKLSIILLIIYYICQSNYPKYALDPLPQTGKHDYSSDTLDKFSGSANLMPPRLCITRNLVSLVIDYVVTLYFFVHYHRFCTIRRQCVEVLEEYATHAILLQTMDDKTMLI